MCWLVWRAVKADQEVLVAEIIILPLEVLTTVYRGLMRYLLMLAILFMAAKIGNMDVSAIFCSFILYSNQKFANLLKYNLND